MVGKVRNDGGMTRSYSGGKAIGDDGKWWVKFSNCVLCATKAHQHDLRLPCRCQSLQLQYRC
jgi:hypothetical protein